MKFKQVYRFPEPLDEKITELINEEPGMGLICPSGMYKGVDLKDCDAWTLDADPEVKPDVLWDMEKLAEHWLIKETKRAHGGFDWFLFDPIWHNDRRCGKCGAYKNTKGIGIHNWVRLLHEIRDCIKLNGRLIVNGIFDVNVPGLEWEKEWTIHKGGSSMLSILSLYRRV